MRLSAGAWLLLLVLVAQDTARAGDLNIDLTLASHVSLSDCGPGLGASWDLVLAGAWAPIPELAVGIEGGLIVPLPTGNESPTVVAVRVNPAVWLRFGSHEEWGYIKFGAGLVDHRRDGEMKPVMVLIGALGFTVAPRALYIHFGFELTGHYDVAGGIPTRAIGIGGFLGYSF